MNDEVRIWVICLGMPFVIIMMVAWGLHYFLALKSTPSIRAGWITGIGYIVASTVWIFGPTQEFAWLGPIAALPGAISIFLFWRKEFRYAWIDESHPLGEGDEIANHDWRIGLWLLIVVLLAAATKVLVFQSAKHLW